MNRGALTVFAVILGLAALVAYLTLFTVSQTQQALVLEFGKPKRVITDPGLQYKIPFIQNVEFFDKRILDIDTASQEVIASDQEAARGRCLRALQDRRSIAVLPDLANERVASARLGAVLEASLRRVLGADRAFDRGARQARVADADDPQSGQPGGDDPSASRSSMCASSASICPRPTCRRSTAACRPSGSGKAAEFRAEGEGASRRIRATADREVTVIKAEATGESERIRGAGDAETEPHLRRSLRPGSRLLRLLPLDAGL